MPSWQDSLIISAGILKGAKQDLVPVNSSAPYYVGIWPVLASAGEKATIAIVRPDADVQAAFNSVPVYNTLGPANGIKLSSGVTYVFPLHPTLQTIGFIYPGTSTALVAVNWIIGRD